MTDNKSMKDNTTMTDNTSLNLDMKAIRAAIPKHCFERSLLRSFGTVIYDLSLTTVVGLIGWYLLPLDGVWTSPLLFSCWMIYAVIQGTVTTGTWVVAHEAGHQAFSEYEIINDTVGLILHTMLLVPYFSWQYTHAKHHSRVNHLLDNETHTPPLGRKAEKQLNKLINALGEEGFAFFQAFTHLFFGWPMYLVFNSTGARRSWLTNKRYETNSKSHFNPYSELFPKKFRFKVLISTLSLVLWIGFLFHIGQNVGFNAVFFMYFCPYLVVNMWLVLITYLQHTHEEVPFYGEEEWNWLRGALCTIDRPYWWPIDSLHHHIGSTHVVHHLFSKLPWYHAREATIHIKKVLGKHYKYDGTPISIATYKTFKHCNYVDDVEGIQYYKSMFKQKTLKQN